jgi:RHS repeat-associated protein
MPVVRVGRSVREKSDPDKETGLACNYFRDYDPQTGRYVQSDPIGLAGGLNTYHHADNNPLRYVDPTGQAAAAVTFGGGGAATGGLGALGPGLAVAGAARRHGDL